MTIPRSEGRSLFGSDPASYDRVRPGYPDRVFEVLGEARALRPGAHVLEIGPGTGQATRPMARAGVASIIALEPDAALAAYLRDKMADEGWPVDVRVGAFEDEELDDGVFDLVIAATSFHWVDQTHGLAKVKRVLRHGGLWAMLWNLFGDPEREDRFHEATQPVLVSLDRSPSGGAEQVPFALEVDARVGDLTASGLVDIEHQLLRWTLTLDAQSIRALYATFSPISRLDTVARRRVLDEIARIAIEEFHDQVDRNMVTSLYTARHR